jgi:acyl-CoA synthetase (AMP-forming)/AMP-acid ligase II
MRPQAHAHANAPAPLRVPRKSLQALLMVDLRKNGGPRCRRREAPPKMSSKTVARTLPGLMMDVPLTITGILRHAVKNHARREIVSRDGDAIVRSTYAQFGARVAQLANALERMGLRAGDRVASFGWNSHRHLELYYAVPCAGMVLHTTNIRLFPAQVAATIAHAGDTAVFVDAALVPAMQAAIASDPGLAHARFVIMGETAHTLPGSVDYETLIADEPHEYFWPELDERSGAILCYTSATTGEPKAALFSHRSTVLHAYATAPVDVFAVAQRDVVLPVVPMFHVNAWGLPFLCPLIGATLVMPGTRLDAPGLIELIEAEAVTFAAGVPTVWLALRDALRARGRGLPTLARVVVGGSSIPPALFDELEAFGTRVIHAWGMTEMSPVGTVSTVTAEIATAPPAVQRRERLKQGAFSFLVDWKVLDDDGNAVPADGTSRGELWVRGPAVAASYYRNAEATAAAFRDGWFRTGDIVTVDAFGFMEIVDRAKDLVKSGGEWISSVEVENALMGHPAVKEACVFGVPHDRWIERPVATVVLRDGERSGEADLRGWLGTRIAKWWIPDRIVFVDAIPRTGVGKFLKRELRDAYATLLTDTNET